MLRIIRFPCSHSKLHHLAKQSNKIALSLTLARPCRKRKVRGKQREVARGQHQVISFLRLCAKKKGSTLYICVKMFNTVYSCLQLEKRLNGNNNILN